MLRIFAFVAAAAIAASAFPAHAEIARAQAPGTGTFDRLAALRLVEHDFLREDSRVFLNRERGETVEAALVVRAARYQLALQRPTGDEFLLVIEARDGARCPGLQTIIVGTRTGRIHHGVCQARLALEFGAHPAYYEAELDRLLGIFQPLLAPHAAARGEES